MLKRSQVNNYRETNPVTNPKFLKNENVRQINVNIGESNVSFILILRNCAIVYAISRQFYKFYC